MDPGIGEYSRERMSIERRRAVRLFLLHLAFYVLGNVFLGGWNALTYFVLGSPTLWFVLPLLFWGVGVIIHYLNSVALFEEWWEHDERIITQRLKG